MKQLSLYLLACLLLLSLIGCSNSNVPPVTSAERLPGGETTSPDNSIPSFMRVARNMPQAERPAFYAGKALAEQPWVKAPTITTARDGLGPLYNARSCIACHANGGRGKIPNDNTTPLFSAFVRISIPGSDSQQGVVSEPMYGDQLQTQSIALSHQIRQPIRAHEIAPEAHIAINWHYQTFTYPDNSTVELRKPELDIQQLGYGPLHKATLYSLRNAPPIHGMGLLELIPQNAIDQLADPQDKNRDGISGRINQVWDIEQQQIVPGRFGLKANRPNQLRIVTAAAFAGDIGISNPLFPQQPCSAMQKNCQQAPTGNNEEDFELPMALLDLVTDFSRNLAVPQRRNMNHPDVKAGRTHFYQSGCANCHTPSFTTADSASQPHLGKQTIWPYSDLLLHDMGEALADGRPDFDASASEWRTPPLWGIGLSQSVNGSNNLLHDGRARNIEEAILWHGGEAQKSRQQFLQLTAKERKQLIQFVESL